MSGKQETIADIIAEKRDEAAAIRADLSCVPIRRDGQLAEADAIDEEADRLEAAWRRDTLQLRREIEHLKDERNKAPVRERERLRKNGFVIVPQERLLTKPADNVNSGAASDSRDNSGDCAKLREALDESRRIASDLGGCRLNDYWKLNEIVRVCDAALAAPPRNCDVGTVEEQEDRFNKYCRGSNYCAVCPIRKLWNFRDGHSPSCTILWAQMPYKAEEGGAE